MTSSASRPFSGPRPPTGTSALSGTTGSPGPADGQAIGGIGFKGQPADGCVEVGYGLAPSARGQGYAAEALVALLDVAHDHGLSRVVADTTGDNVASQRTLERAGFRHMGTNGDTYLYELRLEAHSAQPR